MNDKTYWWSRYGNFAPGTDIYPHMGQVIAQYRLKRGFRTQQDLATVLACSKRTVEELEGTVNMNAPDSVERRQVLARLLKIPPALLANALPILSAFHKFRFAKSRQEAMLVICEKSNRSCPRA